MLLMGFCSAYSAPSLKLSAGTTRNMCSVLTYLRNRSQQLATSFSFSEGATRDIGGSGVYVVNPSQSEKYL